MFENLLKMATEQSFSIVLLLSIAYVLWRTMRADMKKMEKKNEALEEQYHRLENEFRGCIQKGQEDMRQMLLQQGAKQEEMMQLMEHTTSVLEENTLVMKQLLPLAKNFATK